MTISELDSTPTFTARQFELGETDELTASRIADGVIENFHSCVKGDSERHANFYAFFPLAYSQAVIDSDSQHIVSRGEPTHLKAELAVPSKDLLIHTRAHTLFAKYLRSYAGIQTKSDPESEVLARFNEWLDDFSTPSDTSQLVADIGGVTIGKTVCFGEDGSPAGVFYNVPPAPDRTVAASLAVTA